VTQARRPQLAYSELQAKMLDENKRRAKGDKIVAVLESHLGRTDLNGLLALDVGCSAGFIASQLAEAGAKALGVDIDEPGLAKARARFGETVQFIEAPGDALPFADESLDIVVFNHIYEHVVDPDAIITEIHRVLKRDGVAYLALGSKYQIIEPHYRLPFLSWLPQRAADRYVRAFGKADDYYETYRSRAGLIQMLRGFRVWDYTIPLVKAPAAFHSGDQVKYGMSKVPTWAVRAAMAIIPTYIWVVTKGDSAPRLGAGSPGPELLDLSATSRT
jgi:ubiquinone/menaquinone biosynthesis C-methylase UbiE